MNENYGFKFKHSGRYNGIRFFKYASKISEDVKKVKHYKNVLSNNQIFKYKTCISCLVQCFRDHEWRFNENCLFYKKQTISFLKFLFWIEG